ncbi:unnamed protein product [Coffea canephora]|uniref:Uncharacterized protein n=1 Tax=Coffea canephora TaxID=49390 RepID=A0A068UFT1_COFCA|nr:unnamed protein product [Coffea canephora]
MPRMVAQFGYGGASKYISIGQANIGTCPVQARHRRSTTNSRRVGFASLVNKHISISRQEFEFEFVILSSSSGRNFAEVGSCDSAVPTL